MDRIPPIRAGRYEGSARCVILLSIVLTIALRERASARGRSDLSLSNLAGDNVVPDQRGNPDILLVSTSYPSDQNDWRGVFIHNLCAALARRPDMSLAIWAPPGTYPRPARDASTLTERSWLTDLMASGGIAQALRTTPLRGSWKAIRLLRFLRAVYRRESSVSLRHINWLQNSIALPVDAKPLLVTVLGSDMALLRLPGMTSILRRAFAGRRVCICPNAEWMLESLRSQFGDLAAVEYVPFGIDERWFDVKRASLPQGPARWLCVTRVTRPKIGDLLEWCAAPCRSGMHELHLVGPMQDQMSLPDWVHYHGPASAHELCTYWFPRVSGLISLSRHSEGRPQVMLEAMAAGLPIIASRVPAHVDLLDHMKTGWVCDSAEDTQEALDHLGEDELSRAMGSKAREWVRTHVGNWDDCAARYFAIYERLLTP